MLTDEHYRNKNIQLMKRMGGHDQPAEEVDKIYITPFANSLASIVIDAGFSAREIFQVSRTIENSFDKNSLIFKCNFVRALMGNLKVLEEDKQKFVDMAVIAARDGSKSVDDSARLAAVDLWTAAVEHDGVTDFKEPTAVAQSGMRGAEMWAWGPALGLWTALFKQKQGFEKARSVVKEWIESRDELKKRKALVLLTALVEHDGVTDFKEAITLAQQEEIETELAFGLWTALVKKGHGFEEAMVAAKEMWWVKEDNNKQKALLGLWTALVNQRYGFKEATDAAVVTYKSKDVEIQKAALVLWKALCENDGVFKSYEHMPIFCAYSWIRDSKLQQHALDVFEATLKKGIGFDYAEGYVTKLRDDAKRKLEELLKKYPRPVAPSQEMRLKASK